MPLKPSEVGDIVQCYDDLLEVLALQVGARALVGAKPLGIASGCEGACGGEASQLLWGENSNSYTALVGWFGGRLRMWPSQQTRRWAARRRMLV